MTQRFVPSPVQPCGRHALRAMGSLCVASLVFYLMTLFLFFCFSMETAVGFASITIVAILLQLAVSTMGKHVSHHHSVADGIPRELAVLLVFFLGLVAQVVFHPDTLRATAVAILVLFLLAIRMERTGFDLPGFLAWIGILVLCECLVVDKEAPSEDAVILFAIFRLGIFQAVFFAVYVALLVIRIAHQRRASRSQASGDL